MASGIDLINKIDEILAENKKTRTAFAKEINIQTNTMGNWKSNNSMPPADTIVQIAKALNVSVDWLLNDNEHFEEMQQILGEQSRKSVRHRIYKALGEKYKETDNRFTSDFLTNEELLKDLHNSYFNGGHVPYDVLLNWSKGRCEIELHVFNQWAIGLNTTLQYILTGSSVLIPSKKNKYSKQFDEKLYDKAVEFENELRCLDNLTDERKQSAITIINQLTRLEHLEYVEKTRKEK